MDGLALFYLTPDWRSKVFEMDSALLKGKMALMPLPAWKKGGSHGSTWGGTGICITKQCKNQELAWEFVKYLYYTPQYLGKRFLDSNIIPPLKTAWDLPEFKQANPYYSNQPLGTVYALMAPQVPPVYSNPFSNTANTKLANSFTACAQYYKEHGDEGFRDFIRQQVHETAVYVQTKIDRNAFWRGISRAASP
jgi:arabinosaccharide transport system substrate-binding protein